MKMSILLSTLLLSVGIAHANPATPSTTPAPSSNPVAKVVTAMKHAMSKPKAHVAAKPAPVASKTAAPAAK